MDDGVKIRTLKIRQHQSGATFDPVENIHVLDAFLQRKGVIIFSVLRSLRRIKSGQEYDSKCWNGRWTITPRQRMIVSHPLIHQGKYLKTPLFL